MATHQDDNTMSMNFYCTVCASLNMMHGMSYLSYVYATNCVFTRAGLLHLGIFMRMDNNADANRILLACPAADWRRQPGRPHIMWLCTVKQDLKQHHLTLPKQQFWFRTTICG